MSALLSTSSSSSSGTTRRTSSEKVRTEIVHRGRPTIRTRWTVAKIRFHVRRWCSAYNSGDYPNRPPDRLMFDHERKAIYVTGAPSLDRFLTE